VSLSPVESPSAEEPSADNSEEHRIKVAKRRCLFGMLALAAIVGVLEAIFGEDPGTDKALTIVYALTAAFLLVTWCQYDARLYAYRIRKPLLLLIFLLAIIGLPVYLLRARGYRGVIGVAIAAAFLAALLAIEQLAIEATYRLL
jgi:hypothetical protein